MKKTMDSVRSSFVERFGEDEASRFEAAAEMHGNGINDENKGTDPFKWVILICIGYQCAEVERYRNHHGIRSPWREVKGWIKEHADLGTHDGDCDYLSVYSRAYDEYLEKLGPSP